MIDTLIFDFGDVFINLDKKSAHENALKLVRADVIPNLVTKINEQYETGFINDETFLQFYTSHFPWLNNDIVIESWNSMIKDFPKYRLEFLKQLKNEGRFKLILLSNTNQIHINYVKATVPFYEDFKACFDWFFLSHEINLRKPNANIYDFVLKTTDTNPENTIFIDDTRENTVAAHKLGIKTWTINPETDDITELFTKQAHLF
jgi:putative hydrolase of the HAD superfamily